ncbi:hypothetical protein SESBI_27444 [Sesbania bispinosa]|nr:hypothetical protein SESBI_27444 [Sesbania bispinosa]
MALVSGVFHTVKNVCGRRENWRLKMKVVRVWPMCVVTTPNDPFALQVLFVDGEGQMIEVVVYKENMKRFVKAFVEGDVYKVTNFGVSRNTGRFRAARHDYKLVFNANTKVQLCQGISFPFPRLALVKSSEIRKTCGNSKYLLDFMGVLTAISEEINLNKEGRQTRLMLLDLVDEEGDIRCAVFGEMVNTVSGLLSSTTIGLPVVIIQLARVNLYKGKVGIQNVLNASRIYWNPDLPEAIEFKTRQASSMSDEFLHDGFFIILARISEILEDCRWWYTACTCMRRIKFDRGYPFCEHCNACVFELTSRYKIKMLVADGVDDAQVVMFDHECSLLLQSSCRDLLSVNKGNSPDEFPEEISRLVGKELLLRIERQGDGLYTSNDCYKVASLCTDLDLIEDFRSKMEEETPIKMKFAPHFTKMGMVDGETSAYVTKIALLEGDSSAVEVSPHGNSGVSELSVTPFSTGGSSSSPGESISVVKSLGSDSLEGPSENKTIPTMKGVKIE